MNPSRKFAVEIEIVAISKQGGRRYNEDVHGHWHDGRFVACLVADGAGGHGGGDVASATARDHLLGAFARAPTLDPAFLHSLVEQANDAVVARQKEGEKLAAMRTTVVMVAVDLHTDEVVWAHCGDSRAYLFRGGQMLARTTDHSVVQQMVAGGMLDDEGARAHPQRNLLLSALGAADGVIDIAVSQPMPLQPGDVLLLCSDGVWEPLGDAWLARTLQASPSPAVWLQQIDGAITTHAKPDHDNYTAVALWAHAEGEGATQMLPAADALSR